MFKKLLMAICLITTMAVSTQFQGYYISLTFDDGPKMSTTPNGIGGTDLVLDALLKLNSRPGVVCGKNPEQFGVLPCRPGVGCGRVCGTISRVKVTFYVNGGNNSLMESWNHPLGSYELMKRILTEGHEIANHTTTHNLQTGANHQAIRSEIETTERRINEAILFDREATFSTGRPDWEIQMPRDAVYGTFTDFFGRTYSMENRFRSKSFRPNEFTMGPGFTGIDRDFFGPGEHLPWIFAGLDVDDWRMHTAEQMAHYLLHGNHSSCPKCGTAWCSIGRNGIPFPGVMNKRDAADGGIVLLHDGTANFQAGIDMLFLIVPQLQEMGYHFVAMENMFEFMNAKPEWIPANPKAGKGDGTRVNDWVIRGNTPIVPDCPPHNFPEGCETTCTRAGCGVKSPKCGRVDTCENCRGATSISNVDRGNRRHGIRFATNPVDDNAEISVVLPASAASTGSATTNIVIYDMAGNVVFECRDAMHCVSTRWDLRNQAGRIVANGTYLVIAEVKSASGKTYTYSARLGVKR